MIKFHTYRLVLSLPTSDKPNNIFTCKVFNTRTPKKVKKSIHQAKFISYKYLGKCKLNAEFLLKFSFSVSVPQILWSAGSCYFRL